MGLTDFEAGSPVSLAGYFYQRLADPLPGMLSSRSSSSSWGRPGSLPSPGPGLTVTGNPLGSKSPVRGRPQAGAGAAVPVCGTNLELHPQITGKFLGPKLHPQERLTLFLPWKSDFVDMKKGVSTPRSGRPARPPHRPRREERAPPPAASWLALWSPHRVGTLGQGANAQGKSSGQKKDTFFFFF